MIPYNSQSLLSPIIIKVLLYGAFVAATSYPVRADSSDLTQMSLEDLMSVKVTSVSKKETTYRSSPAAVFVISKEDIRRSTANSIPELLRMVPGLHVAQVDGNRWAISARGANGLFANRLLVMIDGRTVYTPIFSGVFWDVQDTPLEDIERIEIIRGPGAALWGANAVNGIINIITKSAKNTEGVLITAGGGDEENAFGTMRYGSNLSSETAGRVYAKGFHRDDQVRETGGDNYDEHSQAQAGFRVDSNLGQNLITIQGDIYNGSEQSEAVAPVATPPFSTVSRTRTEMNGVNLVTRWTRPLFGNDELQIQGYYDRAERSQSIVDQTIDTFDLDSQYRFSLLSDHSVTVGGSYRLIHDDLIGAEPLGVVQFEPESRDLDIAAGFIQDEFPLFSDNLKLTLGCKFEHHEFVGLSTQPSVRAGWNVSEKNFIWAGFSQGTRVPQRAENDARLSLGYIPTEAGATEFVLLGNRSIEPEWVTAYEIGYRTEPFSKTFFDISLFQMHYRSDVIISAGDPTVDPYSSDNTVIIPAEYSNGGEADTYGLEAVLSINPAESIQLQLAYSILEFRESLETEHGMTALSPPQETTNPANQLVLRGMFSLPGDIELDPRLRYVDSLPGVSTDSYIDGDLRIGWRAAKDIVVSLNGENLFHDGHKEYEANFILITPAEIERRIFLKATWTY